VKYTPIWLEDKRQNMFEEMIGSYLARLKECGFDNNIEIKSVTEDPESGARADDSKKRPECRDKLD
jgi:hypothetical protein